MRKKREIEWELGADELADDLSGELYSADLFGSIPGSRVLADMEARGLLKKLRDRGYSTFETSKLSHSSTGDRFVIKADGHELIDLRTRRETLKSGLSALLWEWIGLYHPLGEFKRPALPGQEVPGLGIFREFAELLHAYAVELDFDLLMAIPEYFHNAWLYSSKFRFRNPAYEGRFRAMLRDLLPAGLAEASWALEQNRVLCEGQSVAWEAHTMIYPLDPRMEPRFFHDAYQAEVTREKRRAKFSFTQG